MPDYRFFKVGDDGHITGLRPERTFHDDATAIAYAEQLAGHEMIEIWEGKRLVDCVCFSANSPDVAA
jgi:predicted DNA-binding ribbon-helix-helix protein